MAFLIVSGPESPAMVHRFDDAPIRVGRSPANDLIVRDPLLSRHHFEIRHDPNGWRLADLGSSNGTRLGDRPVIGEVRLEPGSEIRAGSTSMRFEVDQSALDKRSFEDTAHGVTHWSQPGLRLPSEVPILIGKSPAIEALRRFLERAATSPSPVLITGESGTGKELVAQLLHRMSANNQQPFVAVNCPAIPDSLFESELFGVERGAATGVDARPGRFELAGTGTLFLDEIGDLAPALQGKLLRVLETRSIERVGSATPRPIAARFIAATNRDLAAAAKSGNFRLDLYHRLATIPIHLPPLRERREDIPLLIDHFCRRSSPPPRLSEATLAILVGADYPGNIRELEHALEFAQLCADGDEIAPAHLPNGIGDHRAAEDPAEALLRQLLDEGASFWEIVRRPFLDRVLPSSTVRRLIELGYERAGRSYKKMAALFGIEQEHKRLLDFLRNHDLGVRREGSSAPGHHDDPA